MFNRAFFLTILIVIIGVSLGIQLVANNPVEKLIVKGDLSRHERILLYESLQSRLEARIFDVDIFDQVEGATSQFTWIHSINVRRDWPNTLILKVVKIRPVAKWNIGKYLSSQARVIDSVIKHDHLPQFQVAVSSPMRTLEVYRVLASRLKDKRWQISELSESDGGEWSVLISNGLTVRLGRDDLSEGLSRAILAYKGVNPDFRSSIEYIDARYSRAVVLKPLLEVESVNYVGQITND